MSSQWQIFVEGPDDRAFLKGLLQHLNIANVNTSIIGGSVAKLPNIANEIQLLTAKLSALRPVQVSGNM